MAKHCHCHQLYRRAQHLQSQNPNIGQRESWKTLDRCLRLMGHLGEVIGCILHLAYPKLCDTEASILKLDFFHARWNACSSCCSQTEKIMRPRFFYLEMSFPCFFSRWRMQPITSPRFPLRRKQRSNVFHDSLWLMFGFWLCRC